MTRSTQWRSAAPANSMVMGEHSVVYGHPALVCALDQWIQIDWQSTSEASIEIQSALGHVSFAVSELEQVEFAQFRFVIEALKAFSTKLTHGLKIHIQSEFSSTIGLGSSAAVLAAMLKGLNLITEQALSTQQLWMLGHKIILTIQGRGSGADFAASLAGGLVYFQPPKNGVELRLEPLVFEQSLHLFYCGYKTPTAKVLEMVASHWQAQPDALNDIYQRMGEQTQSAYAALQSQNYERFYESCAQYQILMETLGVSDDTLAFITAELNTQNTLKCAKISGSGLGDCVMALGDLPTIPAKLANFQHLSLAITPKGAWAQLINE